MKILIDKHYIWF